MPEKVTIKTDYYICNICGTRYKKEKSAIKCEKKEVYRSKVYAYQWEIGTFLVTKYTGYSGHPSLCKVVGEKIDKSHYSTPIVKKLDGSDTYVNFGVCEAIPYEFINQIIDNASELCKQIVSRKL